MVGDLLIELFVSQHRRTVGLAIAAVDEHQVDIGTVVELFAAQLAERDDAEAAQRAVFQARLAVARHEFRANAAVGDVEDGVRQVGQFLGNIREGGGAEYIAQQNAQQLAAPEACKIDSRRHARAKKTVEPLPIVFQRKDGIETARLGDVQQALRVAQYRFGEKAAVGEDADGAAHGGGVGHDALIGGGRVLPQTCQKVAGALEVRRGRERFRDDHIGHATSVTPVGRPAISRPPRAPDRARPRWRRSRSCPSGRRCNCAASPSGRRPPAGAIHRRYPAPSTGRGAG